MLFHSMLALSRKFWKSLLSTFLLQGQPLEHENLIFHDKDSPAVNHYDIKVLNDQFNTLKPNCKVHENDYHGNAQTAIACSKCNKNYVRSSKAIYQNVVYLGLHINRCTDSYQLSYFK